MLYNLAHREIEWELLPLCVTGGLPIMAYSPIDRGRLVDHLAVKASPRVTTRPPRRSRSRGCFARTASCTIPKAATPAHVRENRAALDLELTREDLATLDRAFPPPTGPRPLPIY